MKATEPVLRRICERRIRGWAVDRREIALSEASESEIIETGWADGEGVGDNEI